MRPSTPEFAAAITGSHSLAVEVTAWHPNAPVETPVPISAGTVTADRGQLVRRTCDITVPGREWLSEDPNHILSPYGGMLRIRRGVTYPDRSRELVDLGVFVIQSAQIDYRVGQVTINAADLMSRLVDDRFEAPRKPPTGTSSTRAVLDLIQETIPDAILTVSPDVTDRNYRGTAVFEEDRAQAAVDIAATLGADVWADPDGTFQIAATPTIDDPPVVTLSSGPGGVLVSAAADLTRDGVYNAVVARSEPTDPDATPLTVTVRDQHAGSPTFYGGPFGRKPRFYSSPLFNDLAQVRAAATALLAKSIGLARSINLSAVPDPRLEPGDVIALWYGGLTETHIIDAVSIPLTAEGDLTAATRVATGTEDLR